MREQYAKHASCVQFNVLSLSVACCHFAIPYKKQNLRDSVIIDISFLNIMCEISNSFRVNSCNSPSPKHVSTCVKLRQWKATVQYLHNRYVILQRTWKMQIKFTTKRKKLTKNGYSMTLFCKNLQTRRKQLTLTQPCPWP